MKKIKNIKQLNAEKKLIKQQETELEDKIRKVWLELKESLRFSNIARDAFSKLHNVAQPLCRNQHFEMV